MNRPGKIDSPLSDEQLLRLEDLLASMNAEQLGWVRAYLEGQSTPAESAAKASTSAGTSLTVLYGSESGNAEGLAEQAAELARAAGQQVQVWDMADYKTRNLRQETQVLIITATHGEGDPPDPARDFYEFLHGRKAPKLDSLRFAVLALGDSSYEHYCQTGRDFDARLEALGAQRIHERIDCDVDYEDAAQDWLQKVLPKFEPAGEGGAGEKVVTLDKARKPAARYDKRHPFAAEVLDSIRLNGRGSEQETYHVELSLEGSGLDYQPGDVLGVAVDNPDALVEQVISGLGLAPDQRVSTSTKDADEEGRRLDEALRQDCELTTLTPALVETWGRLAASEELNRLAASSGELMRFIEDRQVIDLIEDYPPQKMDADEFVSLLRRLQPREYSIASSHLANPGEVHLTVAARRARRQGRERHGLASTHLIDRITPGDTVPVFVRANKNFRLPEDPATALIMIGPGTGVAPFRAFLQEREEQQAQGANWLFFGNPHFRTDFLYQREWQAWLADGLLTRVDLAFSRDQAGKVYVQHRMREHAEELFAWLEAGAHVYVCGDANRMAPDVHAALETIVAEQGGLDAEAANEYIRQMQREKRYQRDVY